MAAVCRKYEYVRLVFEWDISSFYTGPRTVLRDDHALALRTWFIDTNDRLALAYSIEANVSGGGSQNPVYSLSASLNGFPAFWFAQAFGTYLTQGTVELKWVNARDRAGLLDADTIEVRFNGALVATTGPGTFGLQPSNTGCGLFPFGSHISLHPPTASGPLLDGLPSQPYDQSWGEDTTVTMRLLYKEPGKAEYGLPVRFPAMAEPGGTGPFGLSLPDCDPGSSTESITSYLSYRVDNHVGAPATTFDRTTDVCRALVVPDGGGGNARLFVPADYAAQIDGFALEPMYALSQRASTAIVNRLDAVYPGMSAPSQIVTSPVPQSVVDAFGLLVYAGRDVSRFASHEEAGNDYSEKVVWQFPYQYGVNNPTDAWKDYNKQWCDLPNKIIMAVATDLVDGQPAPSNTYWVPLRTQYMALTGRNTRNSIVADPYQNVALNKWGVRFGEAHAISFVTSVQVDSDSAGGWSGTGCTLAHSSVLTVTPTVADCSVVWDALSFVRRPYMYFAVSEKIVLPSISGTFDRVEVFAENGLGDSVKLGDGPGTFVLPRRGSTKYAGTWGVDHDPRSPQSDVGTDSNASGRSSTVASDLRRLVGLGLLLGHAAWRVRLQFTGASGPITLAYPQLKAPTTQPRTFVENAQNTIIAWADGPAVRTGTFHYVGAVSDAVAPSIAAPGTQSDARDFLAFRRMVLEGKHPTDGLAAEMLALFGGATLEAEVVNACRAWVFVGAGGLRYEVVHSGLESGGSHLFFPYDDRDGELSPTGQLGRHAHSHVVEPRRIVCYGSPLHLFEPGGAQATVLDEQFGSYFVTKHSSQVTNDEAADWKLKAGGTEFARARPWFGWFALLALGGKSMPSNQHGPWGGYGVADVTDDGVRFRGSKYGEPPGGVFDIESIVYDGAPADRLFWPHPDHDPRRHEKYVAFGVKDEGQEAYNVLESYSDDFGLTWHDAAVTLAGAMIARSASDQWGNRVRMGFVPDSGADSPGTLVRRYQASGSQAMGAPVTVRGKTGGDLRVEAHGFDVSYSPDVTGRLVLTATPEGETDAKDYESWDDGATFWLIE